MALNPAPPPDDPQIDRSPRSVSNTVGATLMGWNQLVYLSADPDDEDGLNLVPESLVGSLRVTDYGIGVNQRGDAPDYVTGRSDRTAWTKGPVETEGTLTFPFTYGKGIALFVAGANLVFSPGSNFEIQSSVHPRVVGAKINSVELSVNAGEKIELTADVWGVIDLDDLNSFSDPFAVAGANETGAPVLPPSSADGDRAARTLGKEFGVLNGVPTADDTGTNPAPTETNQKLFIEQIPQWDVVAVRGAPNFMQVIGVTLRIDNNLIRNYTMGDWDTLSGTGGASVFGLNATTITANQRTVSGSVVWQSDLEGNITQLLGSGIECLEIEIGVPGGGANYVFRLDNCLWDATPPRVSATDRVTVESSFTALGANDEEFDALVITGPVIA